MDFSTGEEISPPAGKKDIKTSQEDHCLHCQKQQKYTVTLSFLFFPGSFFIFSLFSFFCSSVSARAVFCFLAFDPSSLELLSRFLLKCWGFWHMNVWEKLIPFFLDFLFPAPRFVCSVRKRHHNFLTILAVKSNVFFFRHQFCIWNCMFNVKKMLAYPGTFVSWWNHFTARWYNIMFFDDNIFDPPAFFFTKESPVT